MQGAVVIQKDVFLPVAVDRLIEMVLYRQGIVFTVDGIENARHNGQQGASFPVLRREVQILEMIENRFTPGDKGMFGYSDFPRSPVPVRLYDLYPERFHINNMQVGRSVLDYAL
jgi:hypothetical protein